MDNENGRSGKGGPRKRISEGARERFLDALAETSHVKLAAEMAGFSERAAFHIRRRDPAFAARWRAALMAGYDRLEGAMIRHALGEAHDPIVAGGDAPTGKLDVELAMRLLARHHAAVADGVRSAGTAAFRADRDAAGRTLLAKLKAHEKRAAKAGVSN